MYRRVNLRYTVSILYTLPSPELLLNLFSISRQFFVNISAIDCQLFLTTFRQPFVRRSQTSSRQPLVHLSPTSRQPLVTLCKLLIANLSSYVNMCLTRYFAGTIALWWQELRYHCRTSLRPRSNNSELQPSIWDRPNPWKCSSTDQWWRGSANLSDTPLERNKSHMKLWLIMNQSWFKRDACFFSKSTLRSHFKTELSWSRCVKQRITYC